MVITGLTAAGPHLGRETWRHRSRNLNRSAFNKPRWLRSFDNRASPLACGCSDLPTLDILANVLRDSHVTVHGSGLIFPEAR